MHTAAETRKIGVHGGISYAVSAVGVLQETSEILCENIALYERIAKNRHTGRASLESRLEMREGRVAVALQKNSAVIAAWCLFRVKGRGWIDNRSFLNLCHLWL